MLLIYSKVSFLNQQTISFNLILKNALKGCAWKWTLGELPLFEDIIASKVSKVYNWHKIETESLIRGLQEKRIEKSKAKRCKIEDTSLSASLRAEIAACTATLFYGTI